ncbi:hypothetical protein GYM67_06200 [Bifidobacterium asteroides]|uniref:hypothetical protein n=1 Tax=Bifidobacterium asteroides TaxID=1684 RepID=UPI001C69EBE6|nr:hypothetical protein [Bifidobacterium asteroides]QYN60699.1 hypothetical protein GYM67_06200 [Bifidobacterium asteroides]
MNNLRKYKILITNKGISLNIIEIVCISALLGAIAWGGCWVLFCLFQSINDRAFVFPRIPGWTIIFFIIFGGVYFAWFALALSEPHKLKSKTDVLSASLAAVPNSMYLILALIAVFGIKGKLDYYAFPLWLMIIATAIVIIVSFYDTANGRDLHWFVRTSLYSITGSVFMAFLLRNGFAIDELPKNPVLDSFITSLFSLLTYEYMKQVINERICPATPTTLNEEQVPDKQ